MGLMGSAQEERNIYGHSGKGIKMTKGVIESDASMKLKEMDEKNMHNLFLKNMAGLIEETKNPSPCNNPNSKRGGMATHAGVALELGIHRPQAFDIEQLSKENRKQNFELAFQTGERLAGIPDFISGDDMDDMIKDGRLDSKVVFAYVQEVYRALKEM